MSIVVEAEENLKKFIYLVLVKLMSYSPAVVGLVSVGRSPPAGVPTGISAVISSITETNKKNTVQFCFMKPQKLNFQFEK